MDTVADQQDSVVEAGQYRFRVFDGPGTTSRDKQEPHVRIQKSGDLHINDAAMELIDNPQWVELLYDPQNNVLGLRPADAKNPRAFPRRRDRKRPRIHIFAGRSLTVAHGIDTSATRRYPAEAVDGILVVDLNAGSGGGSGRSTRAGAGGGESDTESS